MTRTESECLFESFCGAQGIVCGRIAETTEQRPDYDLAIAGQQILAEVTQFDPKDEERAAMGRSASSEPVVLGGKPGEKLRRAIGAANGQPRQLLAGPSMPTILVVYNNTECSLHTYPYAVMTAMHGLDVVDVDVPTNQGVPLRWGPVGSGKGRAMRRDANTSTSTVAVLEAVNPNQFQSAVYHNRFAAFQLEPDLPPRGDRTTRAASVQPDGGKTLYRWAGAIQ